MGDQERNRSVDNRSPDIQKLTPVRGDSGSHNEEGQGRQSGADSDEVGDIEHGKAQRCDQLNKLNIVFWY